MISQELLLRIAKDHGVTTGELEVLEAIIISGETISDVAIRLKLQPEAVRKRLGEVYRKFGIIGKGPGKLAKLQQLLMMSRLICHALTAGMVSHFLMVIMLWLS